MTPIDAPPLTSEPRLIVEWVARQLRRIVSESALTPHVVFSVLAVEPAKPALGLVVYADGVQWDPGSGAGLYRYNGSAWVFVG